MIGQLVRFVVCVVISASVFMSLVNTQTISTAQWNIDQPTFVGIIAFFAVLSAIALFFFVEYFFGEDSLEQKIAREEEEFQLQRRVFVNLTVPHFSREMTKAAVADAERRRQACIDADNGTPMPNRNQVGSASYGV